MAATVSSKAFRTNGKRLVVTSVLAAGQTASETGVDSDANPSKHAVVHKLASVNGQEVDLLIRVQEANGSIFVDVVADSSIANLSTTVAAMNLTGFGHPNPQKDKPDTQALVAAGGS